MLLNEIRPFGAGFSSSEAVGRSLLTQQSLDSLYYYASRTQGAIVEIGVYRGGSAMYLAQLGRPLYLYDTFTGMPFHGDLDGNKSGSFSDTNADDIRRLIPEAYVIEGIFPESIINMPPIGFVHADADQYESTKAICELMPERMLPGGMILFDDYGSPGCEGCTQAVKEHFDRIIMLETGKAMVIV